MKFLVTILSGFMLGQSNGKVYYLKRSGKVIPVILQGWQNGGFRFVMKNGAVFRVRHRIDMNIFILDECPIQSAKFACDKHVIKQVLESTQILSSVHHLLGCSPNIKKEKLYRLTHQNHPCVVWARQNKSNYNWLAKHANALSLEYTRRYGKIHACHLLIQLFLFNYPVNLPNGLLTPFVQAMPEEYKIEEKYFAKWKMNNVSYWYTTKI
jgi:hypothetical protein